MTIRTALSKVLFIALQVHQRVKINSIGTFVLREIHKPIDDHVDQLSPLSYAIELHPIEEGAISLSDYVRNHSSIGAKRKKKLTAKVEAAINGFINFGVLEIDSIGIVHLEDGGTTSFSPSESFGDFTEAMSFLPAVKLRSLASDQIDDNAYSHQESTPVITPKSTTDRVYAPPRYTEERSYLPYIAVIAALFCIVGIWIVIRSYGHTSNDNLAEEKVITTDKDSVVSSDAVKAYAHLLTPEVIENGCVIITGTYGNVTNANKAKTAIETSGYTPYEENYRKLRRIGIRFDCMSHDLDSMLLRVRSELNESAWFLYPDYTVEQ